MRVLLVHPPIARSPGLQAELTAMGHELRVAGTAAEAVTEALEFHPEVICTPLELPDGTAHDLAQRLRKCQVLDGATIVALSDTPWEEDGRACSRIDLFITLASLVSILRTTI